MKCKSELSIHKGDQQTGEYIKLQLIDYNLRQTLITEGPLIDLVYLVLRDSDGQIVGGINATLKRNWGLCHIDIFWIDFKYRNRGYGSQLLQQVEEIAKGNGCILVQLETASFQAPKFYRKQGYELICLYNKNVTPVPRLIPTGDSCKTKHLH